MGRKIPGKKHRGIKDPDKQRAVRFSELYTKINNPPKNVDDQDIPKSLLRVIKLKNDVKNSSRVQKKKKKKGSKLIAIGGEYNKAISNKKGRPDKVVPVFNQKLNETEQQFLNRVNRETHAFIKETEFETKYDVDVKRNVETGRIEGIEKKSKDKLTELKRLAHKHSNISKKKNVNNENKLTKSQKKKQKLLNKKQEKDGDIDFTDFKDKVEFGDIVHGPPELNIYPKNINTINKDKSKSLLLNSILEKENSSESKNIKKIIKIQKRKNLPIGERRQIEKQQHDVVTAYKLLKMKKFGQSTISA